jgi:hypothetical protein
VADAPAKVTARDVLDSLHGRWPDDQYLFVEEAPQDSMRQGRKIDALIVSLWKSRGHELDAVEVKVSASDWKRELDHPEKADWWWEHTHRYWIAVPVALAPKVKAELPAAWGLLAVDGGKCREVVKAPRHAATPLAWGECIGIMRAGADAGLAALGRARAAGWNEGREAGQKEAAGGRLDERAQRQLAELRAVVATFTEASGIDLERQSWGSVDEARRLGEAVKVVQQALRDPGHLLNQIARQAAALTAAGQGLAATEQHLRDVLGHGT